ncbi:hypothetical protein Mapa_000192 [Marchantia paleacea]|nr:hypothetical protein Mapa_000192 [Marchantia paleacea]
MDLRDLSTDSWCIVDLASTINQIVYASSISQTVKAFHPRNPYRRSRLEVFESIHQTPKFAMFRTLNIFVMLPSALYSCVDAARVLV